MTNREKTIDAFLKCIRIDDYGFLNADCEHCPNRTNEWEDAMCKDFDELSVEVPWQLAKDMLDLVKAQEPIKPTINVDTWICPKCGHVLENQELIDDKENAQILVCEQYQYCPNCGKEIKWE